MAIVPFSILEAIQAFGGLFGEEIARRLDAMRVYDFRDLAYSRAFKPGMEQDMGPFGNQAALDWDRLTVDWALLSTPS